MLPNIEFIFVTLEVLKLVGRLSEVSEDMP